jgi:hypothetical protein
VQSVTFPAVEFDAGVLRIQVNANHLSASIHGLIEAFGELRQSISLPCAKARAARRQSLAAAVA